MENNISGYTTTEEIANGITHGLGVLLSIAGTIILISNAAAYGDIWQTVSFLIFGGALTLLYAASTLYHSATRPATKRAFKKLDHSAIYLLIAGTYTPFLLIHLKGVLGWGFFSAIWILAFCGILLKLLFIHKYQKLSLAVYLLMGWLSIFLVRELLNHVPPLSIALLFGGGLIYSAGVIFYTWRKLNYNHAIWHVFVLCGSILHFFSILKSV